MVGREHLSRKHHGGESGSWRRLEPGIRGGDFTALGRVARKLRGLRSLAQPGRGLIALCAVVVIGIVSLFLVDLRVRYRSALLEAQSSAERVAQVLAEHTARAFEAVDRTLRVAEAIRLDAMAGRYSSPNSVHRALRNLQESSPLLLAIGWTDASGNLIAHSYEGDPPRPNIADLPHFVDQRDGRASEFYIAPPFRSAANGRFITAVSRRLNGSRGSFEGIVSAPLDQSYFTRIYRSIKPGRNGWVALVRRDGVLLTREPLVESAIGTPYADDRLFTTYLPKSEAGTYEARSLVDGVDRIFAYWTVPGLPLVLLVTSDRSEALEPWYNHIRAVAPFVGLLVGAIVVGACLLAKRSRVLTERSLLLKATLDNIDQGLIVVDADGTLPICNRRAIELLELPPSMMVSRPHLQDVLDYQAARGEFVRTDPSVRALLSPGVLQGTKEVDERARPNGTILEIRTAAFVDGGVVLTYTDITARKQAEQQLRDSEARYRLLADQSTDMVFQLDLTFVRRYVSPASLEILGYAPEELIGRRPVNMIHPEDVERVDATYRAVAEGLDRASVTNRIRHRDGRWIWVEAELRLMRDATIGLPTGILGSLRDISARKQAEAQAAEARKHAEQAAAAQSQFLASMSHELRTPLNSVIGFADLLLERNDLAPEVRRQIGLIQTSGAFLLTVVNDVLDFSKIEEGKLELVPIAFSLTALIDNSVSIVRDLADKRHLDLRVAKDQSVPAYVVGDDNRLRQVLLNLLNNAIKFTRVGHVTLKVENLGTEENTARLHFAISDTGIGISSEKRGRLFQRFSQVDGSTSREYGGTGLGLAICKRLVELMDGEIGVESVEGEGSTFWFRVPLPVAAEASVTVAPPAGLAGLPPLRILLAEDVDVNQEIARAMLEAAGHRVDVVPDGGDAIMAVENNDYDVVLMDVQMPGVDGVTATKHIRALEGPVANVPIIAMTANVLPQQIQSFRAAGMDGHVGKPLSRAQLFAVLERCVSRACPSSNATSVQAETASNVLDAAMFADVTATLGPAKTSDLLRKLAAQLENRFPTDPRSAEEHAQLAREAHKLISTSGMFGFLTLSRSCARLEAAALDQSTDVTTLLQEVRGACRAALVEIVARVGQPGDLQKRG